MRRPIGSRCVRLCGSVGACVWGERGSSPRGCGAPSGTGGYGGGGPGGRSGSAPSTPTPTHLLPGRSGCPSPPHSPVPRHSLQPTLCVARPPLPSSPLSASADVLWSGVSDASMRSRRTRWIASARRKRVPWPRGRARTTTQTTTSAMVAAMTTRSDGWVWHLGRALSLPFRSILFSNSRRAPSCDILGKMADLRLPRSTLPTPHLCTHDTILCMSSSPLQGSAVLSPCLVPHFPVHTWA